MPRDIRFIPPDSLVEVTNRTVEGRFLMAPGRDVNELVRGVLAKARRAGPDPHAKPNPGEC